MVRGVANGSTKIGAVQHSRAIYWATQVSTSFSLIIQCLHIQFKDLISISSCLSPKVLIDGALVVKLDLRNVFFSMTIDIVKLLPE